jgi:hypothetical protein
MEASVMPHRFRRGGIWSAATWIALALIGLVLAAGVSIAASKLTRQHIGIASEPLSAGRELAPATTTTPAQRPAARHRHHHRKHHTSTTTTPPPVNPTPTPVTPPPVTPAPTPAPSPPATQTPPQHRDDSSGKDDSGGTGSGGAHDD